MRKQKIMQKFNLKLKNAPRNTSQVSCSANLQLNRDQSLSVVDGLKNSKLELNNPEVNQLQQVGGLKANVLVLSMDDKPLMPCRPAKARKLLKNGKAKVTRQFPFVIQLQFECENKTQTITGGMDKGYKHIGFSFVTEKKELISGEITLDSKTKDRLIEKRMYRRGRRNKLWYRKPRFLNRKKKEGWLPPSTQRRINAHIKLFEIYCKYLPVSQVNLEIANFDIQKMNNPEINGIDYQQGNLYGYENAKAYILERENGKCQLCEKGFDKNGWHLHHIIERSNGGSNSSNNLALLHKDCHKNLHKKGLKLKKNKEHKSSTFMNVSRNFIINGLQEQFGEVNLTYGYITKIKRIENNIEKTHANDAFIIAGGTAQERCKQTTIIQKHRNNRAIQLNRNGFAPSIRKERYAIQPKDLVWIEGKKYRAVGIQNKGAYVKVENSKKVLATRNIQKIYNFGSFAYNEI